MARQQIPKLWWDVVLDGGTYRVDLDLLPYGNLTALRSAAYREADARARLVATHKVGVRTLIVQAWGALELAAHSAPNLAAAAATAEPAPTIAAASPARVRTHECDCGQGPFSHPLTCNLWNGPKIRPRPPASVTQSPAPAPPQAPWEPDPTSDEDYEPLTPEEEEALLGPCTCGQAPVCLPTCARVGG